MSAEVVRQVRELEVSVFSTPREATLFAAAWLLEEFENNSTCNLMLAGGNTPLALYDEIAAGKQSLGHLTAFALDEYVGVPLEHPRNCANLIRNRAIRPWGIPESQYHCISSRESDAALSIAEHEAKIQAAGGLDLVILGLGQNGHIGFNEPGSIPQDVGRVVPLSSTSTEANRQWFEGEFAPHLGVTTGMSLILAARQIVLLAFGTPKAPAVKGMLSPPSNSNCPASFLQDHPRTFVYVDRLAADHVNLSPSAGNNDP